MIFGESFLKSNKEIRAHMLDFVEREEGATAPEYALMAGLVAGLIVLAVTILGAKVNELFQFVNANYPK